MGAVRLTDRVRPADPPSVGDVARMRQLAADSVAALAPAGAPVVGTGGTITTLAAVHHGLIDYNADVVERTVLTRPLVDALAQRLAALPLTELRRVPGLPAKRADVIVAGTLLLGELMCRLEVDGVGVSAGGLRFALAREALESLQA
jgi:exopolyphosphatase/guanosine-5'-triphosphate,3'-diphosphate pyrophosphatase